MLLLLLLGRISDPPSTSALVLHVNFPEQEVPLDVGKNTYCLVKQPVKTVRWQLQCVSKWKSNFKMLNLYVDGCRCNITYRNTRVST